MNIQGKVVRINPTVSVGANNFQKREIHVETESDSKYPQIIQMEAQGDKVNLFDPLHPGDTANFHVNLRGREWTSPQGETKVFNTIVVWKVEAQTNAPSEPIEPVMPENDLPF